MSKKKVKLQEPIQETTERFLTADEMRQMEIHLEQIKLLEKDKEIITLRLNIKHLEKMVKDLETTILGTKLTDMERMIGEAKIARDTDTKRLKEKYNIKGQFGVNTDTGLIIEE